MSSPKFLQMNTTLDAYANPDQRTAIEVWLKSSIPESATVTKESWIHVIGTYQCMYGIQYELPEA
jgi:hypothetical protein